LRSRGQGKLTFIFKMENFVLTFIGLMAQHPSIQNRVYEEIVSVVGTTRLPELRDQANLRYLDCVISEVHRFNPSIPLVTHSNIEEEIYEGSRIPKKSWIMANVWSVFFGKYFHSLISCRAMLHDENEYPDPDKFYPDRFLLSECNSVPRDPRTLVYGFGRRICPGMHLANSFLFLVVSRIIALYGLRGSPGANESDSARPLEFKTALVP
jgi:cytochrome P450